MKKLKIILLLLCSSTFTFSQVKSPSQLYPGLFEAVEMARIYADSKTFADATPKRRPEDIVKDYNKLKLQPGFNLKAFTTQNFIPPAQIASGYHSDIKAGIRKHIDTLWTVLQRKADAPVKGSSLIALPNPYIVPGGRFGEVYYWDSYFTMLGLEESKRINLIAGIIKNFAYLIDTFGHIPNGNRTYYLTRSQPPYFSLMVELLAKHQGNKILTTYQPELIKEYQFWMHGINRLKVNEVFEHVVKLPDGSILNRFYDAGNQPREEAYREDVLEAKRSSQKPAEFYRNMRSTGESGWDFSSRWMADGKHLYTTQTTNYLPVDLNCLLYNLEMVIARTYKLQGNKNMAATYTSYAAKRKAAINKYCWSPASGCYKDYNWKQKSQSAQITAVTAFPLFFKLADKQQADKVTAFIKSKLLMANGIATTFNLTDQQWDRPNGWAPLQYVTITGLNNYGQQALAKDIALRWIKVNLVNFNKTGKLVEKYNVEGTKEEGRGGEYPSQDGFGWTNGILLKLMNMYK